MKMHFPLWQMKSEFGVILPMSFNSILFLLFLPPVFAGYWLVYNPREDAHVAPTRLRLQNLFIVLASYVFYGWWDWKFLLLISLTSVWAWASGLAIGGLDRLHAGSSETSKKVILIGALAVNLGILGVFKYYNFFLENAMAILSSLGFRAHASSLNVILPVGISFYTFQALSYVVDVYRRDIKPTRDLVAFLAFVSFFPQLVAGPIERATNLLPQFLSPRRFDYALAVDGCRQMLWGFFKKMVVADGCALAANNLLKPTAVNSSLSLLVGLFCFTIQIYCDFSGYSDIAIGLAKTFGIRLKRNFAYPYFSRNIGEFWRRWHISLTTWFKDYLYIPLGGSRCSKIKTIRNTFIIFLVSGLWHGANWTFIAWGLIHAIAFLPALMSGRNRRFTGEIAAYNRGLPNLTELVGIISTFILVMIAWAFFRADTITEAWMWIKRIFLDCDFALTPLKTQGSVHAIVWTGVLFVCEWFNRREEFGFARYPRQRCLRFAIYFILLFVTLLNVSPRQTFIYFQF